jgi:hypothetical protein
MSGVWKSYEGGISDPEPGPRYFTPADECPTGSQPKGEVSMINTRHLVHSAIAAASVVSAVSAARAKQLEAERQAAEAARTAPATGNMTARFRASIPVTVWSSTAAGACVASIMPEPKLVARDTSSATREVPDVRAA